MNDDGEKDKICEHDAELDCSESINESISSENVNDETEVLIKLEKRIELDVDVNDETNFTLSVIRKLTNVWLSNDSISQVLSLNYKNCKEVKVENVHLEESVPEITGKVETINRKLSMFLCARTMKNIKELISGAKGFLYENNTKIHKKFTLPEHMRKIGFMCDPYVKFANFFHYNKVLAEKTKRDVNEFELRKEKMYENKCSSMVIVVHAVQSKSKHVESAFRILDKSSNLSFMSMYGTDSNTRKTMLHKKIFVT